LNSTIVEIYGQEDLEASLRTQFKHYRPTVMINRCIDWKNWNGASIIYELMGNWVEAFECRLRSYSGILKTFSEEDKISEILEEVLSTFNSLLSKVNIKETAADMKLGLVIQLFEFWKEFKFAMEPIEIFLISKMDLLIEPLVTLLEESKEGQVPPWILPFSTKAFLIFLRAHQKELQENNQKNIKVSQEKLWEGIKENLAKNLPKRYKLVVPSISLDGESTEGSMVFTCGHIYKRRTFFESILPEFKQRVDSFPTTIPVTTKLILADYHQSMINLACPSCLYNYLRETQPREANLKTWNI